MICSCDLKACYNNNVNIKRIVIMAAIITVMRGWLYSFFLIKKCIFFFLSACVEKWRRRFNSLCLMWEVTSKLTLTEEKNLICPHSLLSLTKLLASHCCRNDPEVAQCKDCVMQCSYAWSSQRWRACLCIHHLPKPQMWLKTCLYIFIFCCGYSFSV